MWHHYEGLSVFVASDGVVLVTVTRVIVADGMVMPTGTPDEVGEVMWRTDFGSDLDTADSLEEAMANVEEFYRFYGIPDQEERDRSKKTVHQFLFGG